MQVLEAIQHIKQTMGTIIPHYTQELNILDYLLCVNGNGYSWIDGQLGEYVFNEEMDEKEKPLQEDYIPQHLTEKAIFPSGITLYQTTGGIFYPICKYAKIYVIPDNIKADWLETCKILLDIIKNYQDYPTITLSEIRKEFKDTDKQNAEMAEKILLDLGERGL